MSSIVSLVHLSVHQFTPCMHDWLIDWFWFITFFKGPVLSVTSMQRMLFSSSFLWLRLLSPSSCHLAQPIPNFRLLYVDWAFIACTCVPDCPSEQIVKFFWFWSQFCTILPQCVLSCLYFHAVKGYPIAIWSQKCILMPGVEGANKIQITLNLFVSYHMAHILLWDFPQSHSNAPALKQSPKPPTRIE